MEVANARRHRTDGSYGLPYPYRRLPSRPWSLIISGENKRLYYGY